MSTNSVHKSGGYHVYHVTHSVKSTGGEWSTERLIVRAPAFRHYSSEPSYRLISSPRSGRYRLHDGHLPEYQPVVAGPELFAEMARLGVNIASPVA